MPIGDQNWFSENVRDYFAISYRIQAHLHHSQSPYQTIDVYETVRYGKLLALDGCIMLTDRDEAIYHEMLVHIPMLSHQDPRRVLVVGGGDGGTVREVLRHDSVEKVDMVEIDEEVIKVCREYFPDISCRLDDPRVNLVIRDGIEFVKGIEVEYDVVLIDSTDPVGPGEVLFTDEFYQNVLRALKPGGLVALQSESPFGLEGQTETIYRRLRSIFPCTAVYWVSIPCYPPGTWSFTFCSKDGEKPVIRREAAARIIEGGCKYYTRKIHQAAFVLPKFMKEIGKEKC